MKKRMKVLSTLLAFVMCLTLLPVTASALTEGDWEFQLLDGEVQITGYLGEGGDVVIPSTLRGAVVTELKGFSMFYGKATSLTVPGSIKKVEYGATSGWKELTELTFQEGVEEVIGCNIQKFPNLVHINLPSTLKVIGDNAFRNTGITQIAIPGGVKKIGERAFMESKLGSADLSGLTDVKLGVSIFESCKSLSSLKLPLDIQEIPQSLVQYCSSLKHIDLPSGVTKIGTVAFSGCDLQELLLPVSLREINPGAFERNANLKEVVIPYGVTKVGNGGTIIKGSFGYNPKLEALYIPDTVKTMGAGIISDCENCIIYCSSGSYAAEICQKNKISYLTDKSVNSPITVYYQGTRISFDSYDQNPEIVNSRTMVPLRSVFEAMGADIQWDGATQTVTATRKSDKIVMTVGQSGYTVNGAAKTMDTPPMILNSRTMVPVRVVAESFGADVTWHAASATVLINE